MQDKKKASAKAVKSMRFSIFLTPDIVELVNKEMQRRHEDRSTTIRLILREALKEKDV